MGFRDYITNRWFRRRLERDLERYQNIQPPANPSRRYVDKLVRRLLEEHRAWDACKELSMIGAEAVPSLVAALDDERYHQAERDPFESQAPAPLDMVLELLVPHAGDQVLAASTPLVDSPSKDVRKTVAIHLASLGRADTIPLLAKLLQDSEGYVRSYVQMGIDRALSAGRANNDFRKKVYGLMLAQCDQNWGSATNDSAESIIAIDPQRAAHDLASERCLSVANLNTSRILEACNRAAIPLPESLTRPLLDQSLPLAVGERCYPHSYVAAAALDSLALSLGKRARPLLEAALAHENHKIQQSAASGIARLAGIKDPVSYVCGQIEAVGFEGLSHQQQVVYCAFLFDAEVCNGGIMQFFGNSSGDRAVETLDALRELEHREAEAALSVAIKEVGPLAREPDRELRLTAFEGRFDELVAAFRPLEQDYYRTNELLRQKWLLYAARHPEHFCEC